MTVVLTSSIFTLSVTAIKTVVSAPFAVTCQTHYWPDAMERGNDCINIHVLMRQYVHTSSEITVGHVRVGSVWHIKT